MFAIGDIHGCDQQLETLLDSITPVPGDTIILLGDIVDRGPNTARVIEMLMHLQDTAKVVFVRGNHEEMMLDGLAQKNMKRSAWMYHGGKEALDSYGGNIGDIPPWHLDFLMSSVDYHENPYGIFVHATVEKNIPLHAQTVNALRWIKLKGNEPPYMDGRTVYCGHTPQREPLVREGWICIDTGACRGGWLTAVEVHSQTFTMVKKDAMMKDVPVSEFRF
jgi:serine/threonine protein phosphatase 1